MKKYYIVSIYKSTWLNSHHVSAFFFILLAAHRLEALGTSLHQLLSNRMERIRRQKTENEQQNAQERIRRQKTENEQQNAQIKAQLNCGMVSRH